MAEKKTEPAAAEKKERKIPLEKLRRSCVKLFGISPSTFDGAAVGLTESKYTVGEMRAIIEKWLKKEVK